MQAAISSLTRGGATSSQPTYINITPLGQLKSSSASMEVPTAQADVKLRFPMDDLIVPVNSCELHIPKGTRTKKVAVGVVKAIDRTRTPRIHGQPVPEGYARVSVDRVERGCASVLLDIEGGDGEKTLGEVEKTFICWRKRFIIIHGVSPPPPRLVDDQDPTPSPPRRSPTPPWAAPTPPPPSSPPRTWSPMQPWAAPSPPPPPP